MAERNKFTSETGRMAAKIPRDKSPRELRNWLKEVFENQKGNIHEALMEVYEQDKGKYLDKWIQLLQFAYPKLAALKLDVDERRHLIMNFNINSDDDKDAITQIGSEDE